MNPFVWDLPLTPDDPFGNPLLVLLDSIRVFIAVLAGISLLMLIPSLPMARNLPTRYRLICLMLFSIYMLTTEIQRIGFYANWRIMLAVLCAAMTFVSVLLFIRFEGDRRYAPKWARWFSDRMHTSEQVMDRRDREARADEEDAEDEKHA
jgi:uncharacterized protein YhhL (DUF1145 family)